MSAYGINPAESGMMIGTNPPSEECGQTLRKSPGGENGVLQMQNKTDIETAYRIKINLRPAVLCKHRCEECRFCTFSGDEDGGEYVWCRHPNTQSLPDFFNIMEENMVCDLFEPSLDNLMTSVAFLPTNSANAQSIGAEDELSPTLAKGGGESGNKPSVAIGFKAGQSADGGLGDEREVSPTLSHKPSALEPTAAIYPACADTLRRRNDGAVQPDKQNGAAFVAQSQCDLSQMRYIVRRLTPTEAERLMGLPDGWTIPTGLRRYFGADGEPSPELVDEFVERFDTFGAIMAEYEHKPAPKPKSANQVRAWLEKVTNPDTCPDSPRYRATGNGWATNQPRWILTRLLALGEGIDPFTGEEL